LQSGEPYPDLVPPLISNIIAASMVQDEGRREAAIKTIFDSLPECYVTANSRQFGNLHALLQHFCRSVRNAAERCGKRAEQCRTVQDSQECDSWLAYYEKSPDLLKF
jgi:hypothetical protein